MFNEQQPKCLKRKKELFDTHDPETVEFLKYIRTSKADYAQLIRNNLELINLQHKLPGGYTKAGLSLLHCYIIEHNEKPKTLSIEDLEKVWIISEKMKGGVFDEYEGTSKKPKKDRLKKCNRLRKKKL